MKKYTLSEQDKQQYIALLLLNEMINNQHYFPITLEDGDKYLEPLFIQLNAKGFIRIDGARYVPTEQGRTALEAFMKKYAEYLRVFDLYCAVDLTAGEFAFAKFFKMSDTEWENYLNDPRWEDVRIAVAEFKKLNAVEIVFMSFVNENRFDLGRTGWQMDLLGGMIWDQMLDICNTALQPEDLGTPDVIEDIVRQGAALMLDLLKEEEEVRKEQQEEEEPETVTETVTEEYVEPVYVDAYSYGYGYYAPYYDPFYVSPIWLAAAIVLW